MTESRVFEASSSLKRELFIQLLLFYHNELVYVILKIVYCLLRNQNSAEEILKIFRTFMVIA